MPFSNDYKRKLYEPSGLKCLTFTYGALLVRLMNFGLGSVHFIYRLSLVERSLIVRWVVGSILHGVDPLSYFSFQPVLLDWCNKGRGMCYPVCGMVHVKEPLLLIGKISLCGGSGFHLSLSEWSFTIRPMPYNRKQNVLRVSLNKTFPSFLVLLAAAVIIMLLLKHFIQGCIWNSFI